MKLEMLLLVSPRRFVLKTVSLPPQRRSVAMESVTVAMEKAL